MNRSQLNTMLWMRRRILANRMKRSGKLSNVLFGVLVVLGVLASIAAFLFSFWFGVEELEESSPAVIMAVWLGVSLLFAFFWFLGLLTELQRSDSMSFKNLLHLPISLGWVFLYNYFSSFLSISMVLFLPAMIGLSMAMVWNAGASMLLCLLLVLGYLGMVTAVTYQLRGWLAKMMEDKRRGRNIVMGLTFFIVVLAQVPNFLNMATSDDRMARSMLRHELTMKTISAKGAEKEAAQRELDNLIHEDAERSASQQRLINTATVSIPLGWLPYGVRASYEGRIWISLLCAFGMFALTGLSLRRSYRKTLAGVVDGGPVREITKQEEAKVTAGPRKPMLVERNLPWLGEQSSAMTLMTLRALLRAPETKMMLLGPVIMLGLFGVMVSNNDLEGRLFWAPMMTLSAMAMSLLSLQQALQNQFGLDRDGFRAFLLSPVPRDIILLGKNLALVPLGIGVGLTALILLQVVLPQDAPHFLGGIFQLLSAYMLVSLAGNLLSILWPMRLKGVGMKAAGGQGKAFIVHFLSILLIPIALAPLLLPWGAELYLGSLGWLGGVPVYLMLHIALFAGTFAFFRWCLKRQGALLQRRELQILETLTREG